MLKKHSDHVINNLLLVGDNITFYYVMVVFLILALAPWVCWLALLLFPLEIILSPIIVGFGIILSLFLLGLMYTGGSWAYWGIFVAEFGLAMVAIFGEIILIPLAFFTPLNLLLAGASFLLTLIS